MLRHRDSRLDRDGHPHTDKLHAIERYRRPVSRPAASAGARPSG